MNRVESSERIAAHREGFLVWTDVNHQMIEELTQTPPPRAPEEYPHANAPAAIEANSQNPAGVGLYLAASQITRQIPFINQTDENTQSFAERYGMPEEFIPQMESQQVFAGGFNDTRFPFTFGAVLASTVVEEAVKKGLLETMQREQIGLRDWAGIIDSAWFKRLANSMSYTGPVTYGGFSAGIDNYREGDLASQLQTETGWDSAEPLFRFREVEERGFVWHAASLTPECRSSLVRKVEDSDAEGCPLAQYGGRFPDGKMQDAHLRAMVRKGLMRIVQTYDNSDVAITQEESAIDRSLSALAFQLRWYDNLYGTPRLTGNTVQHIPLPIDAPMIVRYA